MECRVRANNLGVLQQTVTIDLREKVMIKSNVVIAMNCEIITHTDMSNSKLTDSYPAMKAPIYTLLHNVFVGFFNQFNGWWIKCSAITRSQVAT